MVVGFHRSCWTGPTPLLTKTTIPNGCTRSFGCSWLRFFCELGLDGDYKYSSELKHKGRLCGGGWREILEVDICYSTLKSLPKKLARMIWRKMLVQFFLWLKISLRNSIKVIWCSGVLNNNVTIHFWRTGFFFIIYLLWRVICTQHGQPASWKL